jgi:hypothetical protein
MAAKASVSSGYRLRLGAVSLMVLVFSAYFFYDGYYGYPRQKKIFDDYQRHVDEGRTDQWEAYASDKGYPSAIHGQPGVNKSDFDILVQRVLGFVLLPVLAVLLYYFLRTFGRWVATDESGLLTSWGARCSFDQIATLDKTRWKKKGIAVVNCKDGGAGKRIVLDDWKYQRDPTNTMLKEVESHLTPDQITGDQSEAAKQAEAETQAGAQAETDAEAQAEPKRPGSAEDESSSETS